MPEVFVIRRKKLETINGYVDHIIFRNADNGYTVLVLIVMRKKLHVLETFRIFLREKTSRQRESIQNTRHMGGSLRFRLSRKRSRRMKQQ